MCPQIAPKLSTAYNLWYVAPMNTLLFWVGGVDALGLVTLVASLFVQWSTALRIRSYSELETALRELNLQVGDLSDHIERKETRERVRKMRDGRAAAAAAPTPELPLSGPDLKSALRRKAMALNGHG